MKDVCFFSFTSNECKTMHDGMVRSVKKFYPDIPFFHYDFNASTQNISVMHFDNGIELSKEYKRVIYIDGDCIMTAPCPRLFETFDLALPLNNCNFGFHGNDSVKAYMNIGLIAITKPEVWEDWKHNFYTLTKQECHDQNMLNVTFWSNKFNTLCLDTEEESYGIQHMHDYPNMYLKDGNIMIGVKKMCCFHAAGNLWKTRTVEWRIIFEKIMDDGARNKLKELTV